MSDFIDGIPGLVPGTDVRGLPLSALEGFVLSRIDGRSGVADLVALTGLPEEQVATIVRRLVALGAVELTQRQEAAQPQRPSQRPPAVANGGERRRAATSFPPLVREYTELRGPRSTRAPEDLDDRSSTREPPPRPSQYPARPLAVEPVGQPVEPAPAPPESAPRPSISVPNQSSDTQIPEFEPLSPLYDPRELEEDIDLPRERRIQVLERFHRLGAVDHYALLGVADDADKKAIKAAYFALSKSFHPDSMFRKELGSYKAKMVRVFQALTEAYEVLSKVKARSEYDAYLKVTRTAARAERAMVIPPIPPITVRPPPPSAPEVVQKPQPEERSPISVRGASMPPPAAPSSPEGVIPAAPEAAPAGRTASDDARRLAQEVIARRLRGVIRPAIPSPDQIDVSPRAEMGSSPNIAGRANPFETPPKTDARQLLSRLTRTLKDVGQITGGDDRVVRAMRLSQAAVERGDLSEATVQIGRAAALAPDRLDLRGEHSRLSQKLAQNLADTWVQQAEFEMKHNKWASAAITWSKVCEGRPDDAVAHRNAASSLLKAGGDLRGAQKCAQRAVILAPNDIDARVLLAQIYLTAGLKLNARRELEAATKLDPKSEMVKNLLVELKG